jgi:hypothetical protein
MSVRPPGPKPASVLHDGAGSLDGDTFEDALDKSPRLPPETRSEVALHLLSDMSDPDVLRYRSIDPGAFVNHHLNQRADAAAKARSDFYAQQENLAGGAIKLEDAAIQLKDAMKVLTPQLRSLPAGRSNEVIRKLTDAGEFERSEAVGPVAEHWNTMSGGQQDAVLASMESIRSPVYRHAAYVNLSKGWKHQSDLQHE